MKIIVVLDDVPEICQLIKLLLEKDPDFHVVTFIKGMDAIEYVKKNRIDLAIIDIKLEKMSGIDAFKQMKEIQPDLKAIVLTGYPTIETARQAIQLGISEYCVKPLEKNMLMKSVSRILHQTESSDKSL